MRKSDNWISALASSLSFLGMLCTSTFNSFSVFSKDMLQAFFTLISILSIFYTAYTAVNSIKNKTSVDDIMKEIKGREKHTR